MGVGRARAGRGVEAEQENPESLRASLYGDEAATGVSGSPMRCPQCKHFEVKGLLYQLSENG